MEKLRLLICFSAMFSCVVLRAQTLNVDDSVQPTDLITNLITSNCDVVSNVSINSDGSGQSINSYGSFTASDNPTFNLTEGIVLTTGTAVNAGTSSALNIDGDIDNWPGSVLYENAVSLPLGTTYNATEVEFSFTALRNNVLIDYVFASEEYVLSTLCSRNEGVVILIKESTAPDTMFTNIALIPGTNEPVTVANIHAERLGVCAANNEIYLGGSRGFSTPFPNYSQYTTTLQAQTNSVMGTEYTVKIIIADEEDGNYDSAVFVGSIDNEQDTPISATYISDGTPVIITNNTINECGEGVVLQLDTLYPVSYTYEWFNGASIISGETTPSLSVTATGNYTARVYQSASCFFEETIEVNLSSNQPGNDLSDLEMCVSTGNSAVFMLSDQDDFALAGRLATNVEYFNNSVSIPENEESAYLGMNGDIITAVVTEASGCMYTSTFTLNVEVNGSFLDPSGYDLILCDSVDPVFNDGFTAVFPSDIEPLLPVLTSGSYSYYDHNNNIITDSGVGTFTSNTNGFLPFRIEYNGNSGCADSTELRVTVNQPPSLTAGTITYIEVCDDGTDGDAQDGFATFDMTPKYNEIQAELDAAGSAATIAFFPNLQLADQNITNSQITNIANYVNDADETIDFIQVIGIRIEDPNGCYAIQGLELRPRYLLTQTNIEDFLACDPDGDGFEDFDLSNKKIEIAVGNNYEISFFKSFSDAENNSNELTDAVYTNQVMGVERLWLRVEDLDTGCVDFDEDSAYIDLIVNPQPSVNVPSMALEPLCAQGSTGVVDGLVSYFNTEVAGEILTDASLVLNYYFTQPDPFDEAATPRITNADNNIASSLPQTYWAMAEDPVSGCFSNPVSFQLQVNPTPIINNNSPNTIVFCYEASNTNPIIPIDSEKDEIVLPADQADILFRYFPTQDLAILGNDDDKLDEADFFVNENTSIWYRIEYNSTGCFVVIEQPIIVNAKPVIDQPDDFLLCVAPGETQAGFLLSSQDSRILNGQVGMLVRYFLSESEAVMGDAANEIPKDSPFDATDGTNIFVRVENDDDPNCYNDQGTIPSFELKIAEYATTGSARPELIECGILGFAEFDLQIIINEITNNGTVNLGSIKFYENPSDAQFQDPVPNNIQIEPAVVDSEIKDTDNNPNTLFFTNSTASSQEIVVRIESLEGCVTFQTFDLLINEVPLVQAIDDIAICDINGDGTENYDLTGIENLNDLDFSQMLRPYSDINEVELNYFTTISGRDAFELDNTSVVDKISDPTNFTINTIGITPIYLVISDVINTSCVFTTEFNLELNALPIITPKPVMVCEDAFGSNQFTIDLDTLNDDFEFYTDADMDVRLDYFSDAAGTIPLSGSYTKTASTNAIYLQAVNTRTNCVSNTIIEIPLVSNLLPVITAPSSSEAVTCDNDGVNDGSTVFDLSSLNSFVLNGQDPNNYTITYFNAASAEMLMDSVVTNNETYTAVITNNDTECENSIDFVFIVNQLPEIDALAVLEFCDDDEITTNTTIVDITQIIGAFNYVTSVQAGANGVKFYSDEQRHNEITAPTAYSKIGDIDELIYLDLMSDDNCVFQTDFTIRINPMPIIDFDSTNPLIFCEDVFGSGEYSVNLESDIGTQVVANSSNYEITFHNDSSATAANEINSPFITGDTTIYVKVINPSTNCENIEPVSIQVLPIPSINNITSSTEICDTDGVNDGVVIYDFNVYKAELLGAQNEFEYEVTYHESEQDAENDITFNLAEITTGTYYVKIQNIISSCYNIGQINMIINTLPEIDDEEIFFCENNPDRIFDKSTNNINDTYLWEFSSDRSSENTSSISLGFNDVGSTATLTVTNSVTNCSASNIFEILAAPTPEILPIVTKNFDTDEVVIELTESGDYLYALTKTNITPNASEVQESNVFTDLLPGRYYAHVIDLNGCGNIQPMEVNFVDYYAYFTPDGIGPAETETWHIHGIEEIPGTVVYIYSRYGVLMNTLYNGSPGWDGYYNGKPMPTDDYWICIQLPDGEIIKDHITLKR